MKYLVTLWKDTYDYEGLMQDFWIKATTDSKERAISLAMTLMDEQISTAMKDNPGFFLLYSPLDKDTKAAPGCGFTRSVNADNNVVKSLYAKVGTGQYDSNHFFVEVVEFPADVVVTAKLFNLKGNWFEVARFFEEEAKKSSSLPPTDNERCSKEAPTNTPLVPLPVRISPNSNRNLSSDDPQPKKNYKELFLRSIKAKRGPRPETPSRTPGNPVCEASLSNPHGKSSSDGVQPKLRGEEFHKRIMAKMGVKPWPRPEESSQASRNPAAEVASTNPYRRPSAAGPRPRESGEAFRKRLLEKLGVKEGPRTEPSS